jgi:hypothetical protein
MLPSTTISILVTMAPKYCEIFYTKAKKHTVYLIEDFMPSEAFSDETLIYN